MPSKLALLIDAENISHKFLPEILDIASQNGDLTVKIIYGKERQLASSQWDKIAKQHEFGIRTANKLDNDADMRLMLDAVHMSYVVKIDIFCIVSNDGHYVPLCEKFHELDKRVIGIGFQNAAKSLVKNCDQFYHLEQKKRQKKQSRTKPPQKKKSGKELRQLVLKAFSIAPYTRSKWISLSALGQALKTLDPNFKTSDYGHSTLSKLVNSMPDFVETQTEGKVITAVRLRSKKRSRNELVDILNRAFESIPDDGDWIKLSRLASEIQRVQPGFKSKTYGRNRLSSLLRTIPDVVELRLGETEIFVRLKSQDSDS